jgi:hypothetical protein
LAIDGILEPFELRLQMLDARRERLQPLLPTRVPATGSSIAHRPVASRAESQPL